MTREEAIKRLKEYEQYAYGRIWHNEEEDTKAFDMAIEALQREDRFLKSMDTNEPLYTEVIRCKECKYCKVIGKTTHYYMCDLYEHPTDEDFFCGDGERGEDAT